MNASDFALGQFKFLALLLLRHGRYNYVRMSSVVAYMFYKNILLSMTFFWYSFANAFSETKWVPEGAIQMYNVFYTALPIIFYGMYDRDIDYSLVLQDPTIYMDGIRNELFNHWTLFCWVFDSIAESALLTVLPLYLLTNFDKETGTMNTYFDPGHLCMTAIVLVVNLKIFTIQHDIYWFTILSQVFSVCSWLLLALMMNRVMYLDPPLGDYYGVWDRLINSRTFWLSLLLLITIYIIKELAVHTVKRIFFDRKRYHMQAQKGGPFGSEACGWSPLEYKQPTDNVNNSGNNNAEIIIDVPLIKAEEGINTHPNSGAETRRNAGETYERVHLQSLH